MLTFFLVPTKSKRTVLRRAKSQIKWWCLFRLTESLIYLTTDFSMTPSLDKGQDECWTNVTAQSVKGKTEGVSRDEGRTCGNHSRRWDLTCLEAPLGSPVPQDLGDLPINCSTLPSNSLLSFRLVVSTEKLNPLFRFSQNSAYISNVSI